MCVWVCVCLMLMLDTLLDRHRRKQRATLSQRGIQSLRARAARGEVRMGAGREVSTKAPLPPTGGSPSPPPAGSVPPAIPSSSSSGPIDRREAIIAEILTTEQTYVQSLQSVINVRATPFIARWHDLSRLAAHWCSSASTGLFGASPRPRSQDRRGRDTASVLEH